jgi:uncharacterized repeat protein (TIGR03803 family)
MISTYENQTGQNRAIALALPARWTLSPKRLKWILGAILIIVFILLANSSLKAQDVLRGLTSNGGPEGKGTAFSIKSNGTAFTVDHGFADWGKYPTGDFVLGNDGNLYGMTSSGGTFSHGTIFKTTTTGAVTVLFQFNLNTTGGYPKGNLVKGADGNFYGVHLVSQHVTAECPHNSCFEVEDVYHSINIHAYEKVEPKASIMNGY